MLGVSPGSKGVGRRIVNCIHLWRGQPGRDGEVLDDPIQLWSILLLHLLSARHRQNHFVGVVIADPSVNDREPNCAVQEPSTAKGLSKHPAKQGNEHNKATDEQPGVAFVLGDRAIHNSYYYTKNQGQKLVLIHKDPCQGPYVPGATL